MKINLCRFVLFTIVLFPLLPDSYAQTTLPYYTGFDNATEKAGWVEFRKGSTTSFNWVVGTSTNAVSPPNAISHDYPVGAASTDTTVDWYVSPGFSFPTGGKIDSFRVNVYNIVGHHGAGDSLIVYLLKGSNNPSLATSRTKLADLTNMAVNNDIMRDTGNFVIPPTTGTSYIAFKYQATNDWFVPTIDNIHISRNAVTAVDPINESDEMTLYPNPAHKSLQIVLGNNGITSADIRILDITRKTILRKNFTRASGTLSIDLVGVLPGMYYVQCVTENGARLIRQVAIAP